MLAAVGFAASTFVANAKTVTVSDTTTKLSTAVADAYSDSDPAIINITVDNLAADTQIILDRPITINGDADNNGVQCDILVDVVGIKAQANLGRDEKCYIEVQAAGDVTISDLKLHPNVTGVTGTNINNLVDAIRMNRPYNLGDLGNYTLNRVYASGSDASNNYIDLETSADLYNSAGVKLWSGQNGSSARAIFQLTKGPDTDLDRAFGRYNATLNNCQAGLARGAAISIPAEEGVFVINGGLYGHSGEDAIRVSGATVSIKGTQTNRVRVVNVPNTPSVNGHGIEIADGTIDVIEYVDVLTITTGNVIAKSGGSAVGTIRYVRGLGKSTPTANATFYITGGQLHNIHDVTMVGSGNNYNPLEIGTGFEGVLTFKDSIFSSENLGTIRNANSDTSGNLTLTNCALPVDGVSGESLNTASPITYITAPPTGGGQLFETGTVTVSPNYLLTRADYDWSAAQGSGNPLNGAGNANVLRPSNAAYDVASSTGGKLTGGAGPAAAGISDWMLMEK